jgi:SCY1-like protein 2
VTSSDMYSLGCLVYAVHCKGSTPFKNHGSLGGLRENSSKPLPGVERLDTDLQGVYSSCFLSFRAHCIMIRAPSVPDYSAS